MQLPSDQPSIERFRRSSYLWKLLKDQLSIQEKLTNTVKSNRLALGRARPPLSLTYKGRETFTKADGKGIVKVKRINKNFHTIVMTQPK